VASLIYIHGRGLKPPADVERRAWLDALNRGLVRLTPGALQWPDDASFRLAYWSDLFYPEPSAVYEPITNDERAGLNPDQAEAIKALVASFWSWRLPQPASPSVDELSQQAPATMNELTRRFEDSFVRDVIKFFGLGFAERCSEPLRSALLETEDDVMVVSHSFGTVVAFEVFVRDLEAINAERAAAGRGALRIDTWVTLGSPLRWAVDLQTLLPDWKEQLLLDAERGLQPLLSGARHYLDVIGNVARRGLGGLLPAMSAASAEASGTVYKLSTKQFPPAFVERWFNIFDTRDPVACGAGFSTLVGGLAVGDTFLFEGHQRAFDISIRNEACPPNVIGVDIRAHADFDGYGQSVQLAQLVADFWLRHPAP
jgi:hypothetical protein